MQECVELRKKPFTGLREKNTAKYLSKKETKQEKKCKTTPQTQTVFKTNTVTKSSLPMVEVLINGIKGQMEADSCLTANIIDKKRFTLLQNALKQKMKLEQTEGKSVTIFGTSLNVE